MSAELSRAVREIQNEAHLLATVQVAGAIESCDWVALSRLSERLTELAQRGLYHDGLGRAGEIAADFAARGGSGEADPR